MADLPKIPGYELLERIGRGSMGEVYRARQLSLDRSVAIKILSPKWAADPTAMERFFLEARAVARLNHPHIIAGIDVGAHEGHPYFVMEYVAGASLKEQLKDGPLPLEPLLRVARQIGLAMAHYHQARFVHRDIKPDNILLDEDGTAKLCDLGLVVRAELDEDDPTQKAGTPWYISPEQIQGKADIDIRSDLYNFGATLYHLATGQPPYGGKRTGDIVNQHLEAEVPDARALRAELPAGLAALLGHLLQKQPGERPADPQAFLTLLEPVERELAARAARPGTPTVVLGGRFPKATRPWIEMLRPLALPSGTLLIAGAIAFALWGNTAPTTEAPALPRSLSPPVVVKPAPGSPPAVVHTAPGPTNRPPADPAAQALAAARDYRRRSPNDYEGAAERLRRVIADHPGTVAARAAQEDIEALARARQAERAADWKTRLEAARAQLKDGAYPQALTALAGLLREAQGETRAEAERLQAAAQAAHDRELQELVQTGEAEAQAGNHAAAIARAQAFLPRATETAHARIQGLIERWASAQRALDLSRREAALHQRGLTAVRQRDFAGLLAALNDPQVAGPDLATAAAFWRETAAAQERFWSLLLTCLDECGQEAFAYRTRGDVAVEGKAFPRTEADTLLHIKVHGRRDVIDVPLLDLTADCFLRILGERAGGLDLAVFGLAHLRPGLAEAGFKAMRLAGEEPPVSLLAQAERVRAEAREATCDQLGRELQSALTGEDWDRALALLDRLAVEAQGTPLLQQRGAELAQTRQRVELELRLRDALANYFHGKQRALARDEIQLDYDFRAAEEANDFSPHKEIRGESQAAVAGGVLEVQGLASFSAPFLAPFSLTMEWTPRGGETNAAILLGPSARPWTNVIVGLGFRGLLPAGNRPIDIELNPKFAGKTVTLPGHFVGLFNGREDDVRVCVGTRFPLLKAGSAHHLILTVADGVIVVKLDGQDLLRGPMAVAADDQSVPFSLFAHGQPIEIERLRIKGRPDRAAMRQRLLASWKR